MNARLAPIVLTPVLAGLLFAGCGGGEVIDPEKAAIAVRFNVQEATGEKVESATCPADVAVEAGRTFECDVVTTSGDRAVVTIEVTNDQADLRFVSLKKP